MVNVIKALLSALLAIVLASSFFPLAALAGQSGIVLAQTVPGINFGTPGQIVSGGNYIWVANGVSKTITKVDRATGSVIGSTSTLTYAPKNLAWDGTSLWVMPSTGGFLAKVNDDLTYTYSASAICSTPGGNDVVAVTPGHVYVSCYNNQSFYEVDPTSLTVLTSITGLGSGPFGLRANNSKVFLDMGTSVKIYQVSNLSLSPAVVTTSMPTNSAHKWALDSNYLYISGSNSGQLAKLLKMNISDNTFSVYDISTVAYANITGIATDGTFVYINNYSESLMSTFNLSTNTLATEFTSTSTPQGVAVITGEVWSVSNGALLKYTQPVQQTVTWSPTNTSNAVSATAITPSSQATSSGTGVISYAVQNAGTTGCTVDPITGAVSGTLPGTCVIRATSASSGAYLSGFVDVSFTFSAQAPAPTPTPTVPSRPSPVVISLSSRFVLPNTVVSHVLLGRNLGEATKISLNGESFEPSSADSDQVVFSTPALPIGTYTITFYLGSAGVLTYQDALVVANPNVQLQTRKFTIASFPAKVSQLTRALADQINRKLKLPNGAINLVCVGFADKGSSDDEKLKLAIARAKSVCAVASKILGIPSKIEIRSDSEISASKVQIFTLGR